MNDLSMRLIDLTQTFTANTPVYPGDPLPKLEPRATLERDGYMDFDLATGMHVGTHIEGPSHMIAGKELLHTTELSNFVGPAVIVDARAHAEIGPEVFAKADFSLAKMVLICTGWSKNFGNDKYYLEYPVITPEAAKLLIDNGIKLVGLDTPSPDQPPFSVHKILLGNGALIIENLTNLEELLATRSCELVALPLKLTSDSAPARVIAKIS